MQFYLDTLTPYYRPEIYYYDDDGNLTLDGKWSYSWDAESRLVEMETLPAAVSAGAKQLKLEFGYDSQGRRFSKKVYEWDGSVYQLTKEVAYIYDGWNLIHEVSDLYNGAESKKFYVWGADLSGSLQGAGGVGGLLMTTDGLGSTFYASFDGNGNVMGYYAADSGIKVAEFEYGPFGELIRETGAKKDDFNFRFSTKYEDAETGLLYYGFRYYDPTTGRWLSRDPIEENGGLNLYGMVGNDCINGWDFLGLKLCPDECEALKERFVEALNYSQSIKEEIALYRGAQQISDELFNARINDQNFLTLQSDSTGLLLASAEGLKNGSSGLAGKASPLLSLPGIYDDVKYIAYAVANDEPGAALKGTKVVVDLSVLKLTTDAAKAATAARGAANARNVLRGTAVTTAFVIASDPWIDGAINQYSRYSHDKKQSSFDGYLEWQAGIIKDVESNAQVLIDRYLENCVD